jgi:hypothetical protein
MKQLIYQLTPTESTTQQVPTLKSRLLAILIAGGMEALRATLSHPLVDIAVEMIKKLLEMK